MCGVKLADQRNGINREFWSRVKKLLLAVSATEWHEQNAKNEAS